MVHWNINFAVIISKPCSCKNMRRYMTRIHNKNWFKSENFDAAAFHKVTAFYRLGSLAEIQGSTTSYLAYRTSDLMLYYHCNSQLIQSIIYSSRGRQPTARVPRTPSNLQWHAEAPSFTYNFVDSHRRYIDLDMYKNSMLLAHWMIWSLSRHTVSKSLPTSEFFYILYNTIYI